jgi:plasmid stability protein
MPDVLVRDVEEATLAKLKERARGNGRSLGAELRFILEQAARTVDMSRARALAEQMTRRLADRPHSDSTELLREDRRR